MVGWVAVVVVAVNCVPHTRYTPALAIWISRDLAWGCGGKREPGFDTQPRLDGRTERKATAEVVQLSW